jgi:hypothetical protein
MAPSNLGRVPVTGDFEAKIDIEKLLKTEK